MKKTKTDKVTGKFFVTGLLVFLGASIVVLTMVYIFQGDLQKDLKLPAFQEVQDKLKTKLVVKETKKINISNEKMYAPSCYCVPDRAKYKLTDKCTPTSIRCRRETETHSINLSSGEYRITLKLSSLTDTQKFESIVFKLNGKEIATVSDLGGDKNNAGTATYVIPGGNRKLSGKTTIKAEHKYRDTFTGKWYSDPSTQLGVGDVVESINLDTVVFEKMEPEPYCGDGIKDPGEECDDGNNKDGDGCSSTCKKPDKCNDVCLATIACDGGYACYVTSGTSPDLFGHCRNSKCTSETDCVCATCGDGKKDPGEECDDGNNNSGDGCEKDCTKPDKCNDICTSAIGCDEGYACSSDHCRNTSCTLETDCICATCGDGKKDPGEECDDGNNINGDGCEANCTKTKEEPTPTPTPTPKPKEKESSCDGAIGNTVWYDKNGDGNQDDDEPGISGVKVKAMNGNRDWSDTTNDRGRYKIKGLCKGTYLVKVNKSDVASLTQTYDPDGKLDDKTDVRLKNDKDYHTKADFGYRGGAALKTGVGMNIAIILLVSLAITSGIMALLMKFKKV